MAGSVLLFAAIAGVVGSQDLASRKLVFQADATYRQWACVEHELHQDIPPHEPVFVDASDALFFQRLTEMLTPRDTLVANRDGANYKASVRRVRGAVDSCSGLQVQVRFVGHPK
jgi:hypothetical protein